MEADIVLNDLTQYMGICDFLEKRPTEVSVPHLLSKIKESLTAACRTNLCFEALVSKEVTAEQACPTSSSLSIVFVPQTFRALTRARLDHDAVLRLGISDRGLRTLPAWFKSVDVVDPWWQKIIAAGSGRTMTDGDAAKAFVGRALWIALNDPSDSQLVRSLGGRISSLRHERARVVLSAVVNAMDDSQAIKLIRNATNPHHVLTSLASDFGNALEEHCKYFISDNNISWISSSNWEQSYFKNSRNATIVTDNIRINEELEKVFYRSWDSNFTEKVDIDRKYESVKRN